MSASIFPPESNANVPSDESAFEPLPSGAMELRQFLKTAIRITSALAQLHTNDTIHRNIRPHNIRLHGPSGYVKLLGQAGAYAVRDPQREAAEAAQALPYMSPEQTEDMKRPVDHRSDLYSVGVVFYEMLSGKLPFHAEDPIGWVQAHLTLEPPPLTVVMPETPQAVSDIVGKLLQKTVEERYQSARGLLIDLETCLVELRAKGAIEPFPLGARDVWHGLRISAKLYGRENEAVALFAAFERVVNTTKPEIALVSGFSGIGKTSVVLALHKPIVRERGFFLSGKFDQHKRNIPYVTIGQAFRDLIRQILTERTSQIEIWKQRIIEALGPNAQLVIDIIPQLEELIGKQPPVPELPIQDARNRFNMVFRGFLSVFARREHPLVLFLDDLQYADWASLALLGDVITHFDTKHLLVLGAYRDNEVSPSHPAIMTLDEIKKAGVHFTDVVLRPLAIEHLQHLVADTFHCSFEQALPLAALLHKKTNGNPFFANQFLAELHHENLVRFDVDNSIWHWDIAEIEAKEFTDDVVELMASKLRRLPGETQAALQLAACIGSEFDVEMLQLTHDKTPEETYQDLDPAVRGEFMLRRGNTYKFMHDRVHQAAYSLIPQEQVNWVHLRIGRLLLERTPEAERDDRVFDIVNQFNIGKVYITEADEQRDVATLNLTAGIKAKASVAYRAASTYLGAGISLLPEHPWSTDYRLTFDLHMHQAECEYLIGRFEETERLCELLKEHAENIIDKAAVYRILIQLHITKAENAKSVEVGLECLRLFGIDLSPQPSGEAVVEEIKRVRKNMEGRSVESLIDLPLIAEPEKIAQLATLSGVFLAAFYTDPNLADMLVCRMVDLSVQHGIAPASTMGLACFGLAHFTRLNDPKEAYRFGTVAYDLTEKYGFLAFKAEVCNVYASMISHWNRHVDMFVKYARVGFQAAREAGNILYGCFNTLQTVTGLFAKGSPLPEVYAESNATMDFLTAAKAMYVADAVMSMRRTIQKMRGLTDNFTSFDGEGWNEEEFDNHMLTASVPVAHFFDRTYRLFGRFMSGEYDKAMHHAEIARSLLQYTFGQITQPQYWLYSALTAASHYKTVPEEKQKEYRSLIEEHRDKLRAASENCPENYLAMYTLVAAEIARLDGKSDEVEKLYEQAILAAGQNGYHQIEGIANELASRFDAERGLADKAAKHLQGARACYTRWGAVGKVRQLENLFPDILLTKEDSRA